jgi:hypothetical protein
LSVADSNAKECYKQYSEGVPNVLLHDVGPWSSEITCSCH